VDEDVDPCRRRRKVLGVPRRGQVTRDRACTARALRNDGEPLGVTSGDDQLGAGLGQRDRDRRADAASGARDEREPAIEE
jgi:hypothetical protein